MPDILIILGKKAHGLTDEQLDKLEQRITKVIEKVFEIEGRHDVAFTCINARYTKREADIQFDIDFSTGEDEYGKGEIFDPPMETKKLLIERIREVFAAFIKDQKLSLIGSVWVRPFSGSIFQML